MSGTGTSEAALSDRKSDSKPDTGSRGPLGNPAVLAFLASAVLFGAYALGYIPQVGSLLEAAIRSGRETTLPALSPAFYGIAGLAAFLLLLAVLRSVDILLRRARKAKPLATRPLKSLTDFIEEAAVGNVSLRVAREGYHLLEPLYPHLMCVDLADDLRTDLLLSDEAVRLLGAKLLTRCDRHDISGTTVEPEAFAVVTVFDLLYRVETAAPLRAERLSGLRNRATDPAVEPAALGQRSSSSAERKALHAAALRAIESRSMCVPDAPGLSRRSSDYTGPRRRATDNQTDPVHKGPYRRSVDRGLPSSGERKVETVEDPAKLNRLDPLFVPPQNQRISGKRSLPDKVCPPDDMGLTSDRLY